MIYIKKNDFDFSNKDVKEISKHFNFSELTSRILLSRGLNAENIEALLSDELEKDSFGIQIPNIDLAAERIEKAIMTGEKIAVFGDYDADGICGTSIIINSFKMFGYDDAFYYIPNRISEGYGLNNYALDIIKEQGCTLIITVDCGISNVAEVQYAKEQGIDVIVTDHHLPGDTLPETIVVNPKLSSNEQLHNLCGAMVALKLMCVLFDDGLYYEYCDLAAIATIADMVELVGENRHILKMGLKKINEKSNQNINCLIDECIKNKKTIKSDDISYFIAPAINAAGRLDVADKCVELFTGNSEDPRETAAILAHDNYNRRKIEKETLESALFEIENLDLSKNKAIILYNKSWHQGVLGIAASKIKNIYFRPVILFTENEGLMVGSARSVEGLNIHEAIDHCKQYISHFGGHFMAAGLSLSKENFEPFKAKFEEFISEIDQNIFIPKTVFDVEALTDEINMDFINEIDRIEPFGKGNPSPAVLVKNIEISNYTKMGDADQHFRCKIKNGKSEVSAVAFSNEIIFSDNLKYDAVISPQRNNWNGKSAVQAIVQSIKPIYTENMMKELIAQKENEFELSISQMYYEGKGEVTVKKDYEYLASCLKQSAFSTLILAIDPHSANEVIKKLDKNLEELNIRFGKIENEKSNYNTLVIAPDVEMLNCRGYKNIFVISRHVVEDSFKTLQCEGKVYIINDYQNNELVYNLNINRLREIYLIAKKALLVKNYELFFKGNSQVKLWEIRAGIKIFKEVQLMDYDFNSNKFALTDKVKVDITSSNTYKNFLAGC